MKTLTNVFFLCIVLLISCKREVDYVNPVEELRNDPILKKSNAAKNSLAAVLLNSYDSKDYKEAKKKGENKEYIKNLRQGATYNGLSLKQAEKNDFYYTSILVKKYVISGKMTKEVLLQTLKEERMKNKMNKKK